MTEHSPKRRQFIQRAGLAGAGIALLGPVALSGETGIFESEDDLMISLAQWSLHRAHWSGEMTALDFASKAREFGIGAIEFVSQLCGDKAKDRGFLAELNKRGGDNGVKHLLVMIDGEGRLAASSKAEREKSVESHKKWIEAAKYLGCHSVRVNASGEGTREEMHDQAVDGLASLAEFAKDFNLNVTVENHGGLSSDGSWLSGVMEAIDMPNCGTLPDFGNFCITREEGRCVEEYDRYKGMRELMPFAKAVSAKSYDFGPDGEEMHIDFKRMLGIVRKAGYKGYVGVEYEGQVLSEEEGVKATKALLEKYI